MRILLYKIINKCEYKESEIEKIKLKIIDIQKAK